MENFSTYLVEAGSSQNMHLTHIEDLVLYGPSQFETAISILDGVVRQMTGESPTQAPKLSLKWDGKPALIAGIDPADSKFFIGTKSAIGGSSGRIKALKDVDKLYGDRGGEFADLLKLCFSELRNLAFKPGQILAGDLVAHPKVIKKISYKNEPHIAFRPNTLTYIVPEDSPLGQEISTCSIGIVWHTQMKQDKAGKLNKSPLPDKFVLPACGSNSVWQARASVPDFSGKVLLTKKETAECESRLKDIRSFSKRKGEFLLTLSMNPPLQAALQKYLVDATRYLTEAPQVSYAKKLNAAAFYKWATVSYFPIKWKTSDTVEKNKELLKRWISDIQTLFEVITDITVIKTIILQKLNKLSEFSSFVEGSDGEFSVAASEGYVAIDSNKNMVKLVDRVNFTAANYFRNNS